MVPPDGLPGARPQTLCSSGSTMQVIEPLVGDESPDQGSQLTKATSLAPALHPWRIESRLRRTRLGCPPL